MTYPRTVTAQLLDYDGTVLTPGTQLDNAFDIEFYDEWNGPGTGSCALALSEPGGVDLLPGRYVNVLVEGTARFTFKIEGNPEYDIIQRGEEFEQVIKVGGRGWACVLDEAIIYPEYALNFSLDTTWRVFSFASALFPNAGSWGAAIEQAEYLEGVTTAECYGHFQTAPDGLPYPAPIGFPWPTDPFNLVLGVPTANYVNSYWIRTDDQPDYVSPGYWFFRSEFTLADFTPVTFTCTGDNFFTLFLEGVAILGEEISTADHWMWQGWKEHQLWLPAGTYTVAAAVYNIAFSEMGATPPYPYQPPCPSEGWAGGNRDENVGGLLFVAFIDGDQATAPTHILSSDDSWVSHYELDTWPGWTPGQISDQEISEAVARGEMTVFSSVTYTDADDSNGDPWRPVDVTVDRPDIPLFAIDVGSTIMQSLQQMHSQGYVNWHVQPGTLVLDMYRGRMPTPTSVATLAAGVNLRALERSSTAPYANALLVQWEGGYEPVEDAGAIAAYGTKVTSLFSSDAPTKEEAIVQGQTELVRRAQSQFPSIVVVVEPTSSADCPYEGYTLGEYVTVPAVGGGTEVVRCLSISCRQDDMGYAIWTNELNAKLDVPERSQQQLLQQIGGTNQIVRGAVNR